MPRIDRFGLIIHDTSYYAANNFVASITTINWEDQYSGVLFMKYMYDGNLVGFLRDERGEVRQVWESGTNHLPHSGVLPATLTSSLN